MLPVSLQRIYNTEAITSDHYEIFLSFRLQSLCPPLSSSVLICTQLLQVKVKVTLRLTVSQSVSLGVEPHLGLMTRYLLLFDSYGLVLRGALSDERTGLSFVYAAGPRQRSLSRVRVPWDSRPHFIVSDLRLPFSSPPTTRTSQSQVKVTLRLTVSQSVCLGVEPFLLV
jgi:hypothetical protein